MSKVKTDRSTKSGWEWNRPAGHEDQPVVEWWFEQVAVWIVLVIGKRAFRRNDSQTLNRMLAISQAGHSSDRK